METTSTEKRTYGWYITHRFDNNDVPYDTTTYGEPINAPSSVKHRENMTTLGILNEVPTLENIRPLVDMYATWFDKVEGHWDIFRQDNNGPLTTLHWNLGTILQDPTIDPKIIRYASQVSSHHVIACVGNPSCPTDIIQNMIDVSGSKVDPTRETKGGEVICFILRNKKLTPSMVDQCAKKTKKVTIQRDCVKHSNVSRDTLVYLSEHGRSETVKRDALQMMVKRGMLKV